MHVRGLKKGELTRGGVEGLKRDEEKTGREGPDKKGDGNHRRVVKKMNEMAGPFEKQKLA